jgi:signal peptidase
MSIARILNIASIFLTALLICFAVLLMASLLPIPGNYRVLTVLSGSMEPTIHVGSIVVIAPAKDYKTGDVITFGEIGQAKVPITHRINDVKTEDGQPVFITKGDANNAPDTNEAPYSSVDGKVLFSVPLLGYALFFLKKPIGFVAVIIIPAGLVIFEEIKKIRREMDQDKKTQTAAGETKNKENRNG